VVLGVAFDIDRYFRFILRNMNANFADISKYTHRGDGG
jgi:hypothetical protein